MTTLLLIDDSEDDRCLYRRYLSDYTIEEADSGDKGLELYKSKEIDAVLLDYSLPGHNGLDILKQLKEENPHVAVVFLTGQGDERIAVKAMQLGAQDYVPKDQIDKDMIAHIVANALEKMQLQETIEKQKKELEEAKAIAEEANSAKSRFLATMSHEIRTPMNGVIMATELLQCTELNEKQQRYVGTINSSGDMLMALINDILDFSKIEAGELKLENKEFDILDAIEKVIRILEEGAKGKDVTLSCHIDKDTPKFIISDPVRIEQVLINLLNNAVKFSPGKTVDLHVSVLKKEKSSVTLKFEVKDTGIGIAKEKLEHIFEHFSQADTSTTRQYGGTGLGLAIVKRIIGLMGGEIQVESQEGKGSNFWFDAAFKTP